ncbi:hypothetical protein BDU57DRAFT_52788 [Ampelomyces quisqualis]|uniref:Uncharacterized protein n=1 Tax=Ampelomyces quisqualis TaxID=50730 RepID=A0A6A5R6L6_AMPQU|nr:hypothetical protein BDU57DRAFT_52788 [Ampelomyces quisqualis]
MPRPCQRRRDRAAAQRKSQPSTKPAGPPPIQHKKRQKALHNANRRARLLRSNSGVEAKHASMSSFGGTGNTFNALSGDDSGDDGDMTDSGSEHDDGDDSALHATGTLTINVEVQRVSRGGALAPVSSGSIALGTQGAAVMFPMVQAMAIYKELSRAGFPLQRMAMARYGRDSQPSTRTAPSGAGAVRPQPSNAARDYVFDFGAHKGVAFTEVPENYLRTLAGNPFLVEKHPGVAEALDYHRPNMRRKVPTQKQLASHGQGPVQATWRGRLQGPRGNANKPWTTFTFPSGAHAKKKLNEVPENYLRTIEGMAHVVNKWVGLREALLDYRAKTGRQTKMAA